MSSLCRYEGVHEVMVIEALLSDSTIRLSDLQSVRAVKVESQSCKDTTEAARFPSVALVVRTVRTCAL